MAIRLLRQETFRILSTSWFPLWLSFEDRCELAAPWTPQEMPARRTDRCKKSSQLLIHSAWWNLHVRCNRNQMLICLSIVGRKFVKALDFVSKLPQLIHAKTSARASSFWIWELSGDFSGSWPSKTAFLVDVKKTFPRQLQSDLMLSPWGLDDKETLGARSQAFWRGFGSPCWTIILPPWWYGIGLYSLGVPEFLLEASSLCLRNFKVDCWYI